MTFYALKLVKSASLWSDCSTFQYCFLVSLFPVVFLSNAVNVMFTKDVKSNFSTKHNLSDLFNLSAIYTWKSKSDNIYIYDELYSLEVTL